MHTLLYWLISFLIAFLITWGVLAVIVQWMNPQFTNDDGSVNLATVAWVAALIIIFTWIVLWIIYYLYAIWTAPCEVAMDIKMPCEKQCGVDFGGRVMPF